MGAQQVPPIYQYRIVLPFDDKVLNVATDLDFNISGDVKLPINSNITAKSNFSVSKCCNYFLFFNISYL